MHIDFEQVKKSLKTERESWDRRYGEEKKAKRHHIRIVEIYLLSCI